jgi:hypothetical protein
MDPGNISLAPWPHRNRRADYLEGSPRRNLPQAIEAGDTTLLRKIAVQRKSLTDQQRQALTLVADLLDRPAALPPRDQAARIAAACRSIPVEDREKRPSPDEGDVQNPDLDRAFDEMVGSSRANRPADTTVVQFPDVRPAAIVDRNIEDAGGNYECPECGHDNPGKNRFCGMCGAEHAEILTVPARRVTDEGASALNLASSSNVQHHHHYYHHHHYRSSPYLIVSIFMLLAVIAWHAGWEYGLRASLPRTPSPTTARVQPTVSPGAKTNPVPVTPQTSDRGLEASPVRRSRTSAAKRQPTYHRHETEVFWSMRPERQSGVGTVPRSTAPPRVVKKITDE